VQPIADWKLPVGDWLQCILHMKQLQDVSAFNAPQLQILVQRIVSLDLSLNDLEHLDGLHHLSQLCELNLSFNHLHSLSGIETLFNLRRLDVSNNHIAELDHLAHLSMLTELVRRFVLASLTI